MQAYDPEYAGKQVEAQGQTEFGRNPVRPDQGQRYPAPVQNQPQQQQRQPRGAEYRYNDGDTAMEEAGYQPRDPHRVRGNALADRLGPRHLRENDARFRLDEI